MFASVFKIAMCNVIGKLFQFLYFFLNFIYVKLQVSEPQPLRPEKVCVAAPATQYSS
jgi:hypothetical protein